MEENSHGHHDVPWTRLPDKTASSIITYTKSIFARHGIPEEIVSDNMLFGSREFKDFAYEWGLKTTTSSPTYAQTNGQAESCVQTLKEIFKKADEDGRDSYLALFEYRNTPVSALQYTPSQMLMSRLLRSKLPTKQTLLQPNVVDAHGDLTCRQQRHKTYYDKSASPLQQLNPGDVVRVQRGNVWEPAVDTGLTSSLAPTLCRASMDDCDITEGISTKQTRRLRCSLRSMDCPQ